MPVFTKAEAKRRLDHEIEDAQFRYEKAIHEIEARDAKKTKQRHLYDRRGLGVRARNALTWLGTDDARKIAEGGIAGLMGIPNLGNKSIREIVNWVESEGFTMNPKKDAAYYRRTQRSDYEKQMNVIWSSPKEPVGTEPWEYRGPLRQP